jgi:mono/diheme cytochrome c family protein
MRRFLIGVGVAYLILAAAGWLVVERGWVQAAADRRPGAFERWAALHSLHTAIRRESQGLVDPLPSGDESFLRGARVYEANCLVCHGSADGKASAIARGLNVSPPQFAFDGVDDDPEGETYWKVKHGIRFTGMPAYGGSLSEEEMWQVTRFVSHLPHLPPAAATAWQAMPTPR